MEECDGNGGGVDRNSDGYGTVMAAAAVMAESGGGQQQQ